MDAAETEEDWASVCLAVDDMDAAVEVFEFDVQLLEPFPYQGQHAQELGEDQGLVVADVLGDLAGQLVQFYGMVGIFVRFVQDGGGVADLYFLSYAAQCDAGATAVEPSASDEFVQDLHEQLAQGIAGAADGVIEIVPVVS